MQDFHKILNLWYQQNKRILPWRKNHEPYSVWVSEIILQQTRISQGTDYFIRFIQQFPDIRSLASASEEEILKTWQGLGYYSRARNMHAAARQIINQYNGQFPETYDELKKLKGIGDYTAAAIASISFGAEKAVVDGNVFRVLSRIFGIQTPIDTLKGKKELSELAQSLLDKQNPGHYNEALMDFGAIQCTPRNPSCTACLFKDKCYAFLNSKIDYFPVRSKKVSQKKRYFNFLFIRHKNNFFFEQRIAKDIWHNLYQLPLIETFTQIDESELISIPEFASLIKGLKVTVKADSPTFIHPLTHQNLSIRFFQISLPKPIKNSAWIATDFKSFSRYPVPKPIEAYLTNKLLKSDTK